MNTASWLVSGETDLAALGTNGRNTVAVAVNQDRAE